MPKLSFACRVESAILWTACLVAMNVNAQSRLPTIPATSCTLERKQAATDFDASRKVRVFGPFEPLMHSPQVMSQARAMGDYLRYKSAIGTTQSELAILVTAREWTQDYEWCVLSDCAQGRYQDAHRRCHRRWPEFSRSSDCRAGKPSIRR